MRNLALAMVLFASLSVGAAQSGEDRILAMRGIAPDGALAVNRFKQKKKSATRFDATSPAYLGWRDACTSGRVVLADRTVEWKGEKSFGMTPRFVDTNGPSQTGEFLDLLIKELTRPEI